MKTHDKPKKEAAPKSPKEDSRSSTERASKDSSRWGDLPAKLHDDARKGRSEKIPERLRDAFEKYGEAFTDERRAK